MQKYPTFDKDGHISDETYETIKQWDAANDGEALVEYVCYCWDRGYGKILYGYRDKRRTITFITGGWSANETILSALSENLTFLPFYWHSSYRGGKVVCYLPPHQCRPEPPDRSCCCSVIALEPDDDCPVHGYPYPTPPRCRCGKFVSNLPKL